MGNIVTKQPKKYMTAGTAVIAQPMTGTAGTAGTAVMGQPMSSVGTAVIAQPMTGTARTAVIAQPIAAMKSAIVGTKTRENFTVYGDDQSSNIIVLLVILALIIAIGYAYYKLK